MYRINKSGGYIRLSDNACIPNDPANIDFQAVQVWIAKGNAPQPIDSPSIQERINANINAIQSAMDSKAQSKGYDNILSACSYAGGDPEDPFQAEGKAFLKWRSDVWSQAYSILAEVEAGVRALPTPEQSVAAMPELVLP